MYTLTKLDPFDFLLTAVNFDDQYLLNSGTKLYQNGGTVFALKDGNEILTLALTLPYNKYQRIVRLYTRPQFRRQGYALKLIQKLQETYPHLTCFSITERAEHKIISALLIKAGFRPTSTYFSFSIQCDNLIGWGQTPTGQKITRCANRFLRKDLRLINFNQATPEQLDYIKNAKNNAFQSTLSPESLFNDEIHLCKEASYILLHKDLPIAFNIFSQPLPNCYTFEIIDTARDWLGRGYASIIYWAVLNFFPNKGLEGHTCRYNIHIANTMALKMQKKIVGTFPKRRYTQQWYNWSKEK